MTKAIRGVLFDKDGTLFDFAATWEAWAKSFLLRASDGDRGKAATAGATLGFDFKAGKFAPDSVVIAGTPEEVATALAPLYPDMSHEAMIDLLNDEAALAPQSEAVPLQPFLRRLQEAGLCLGVATNDAEAPARAHLDAAGVTDMFDFIVGFDSGFGGKPAPGQLIAFCEAVGLTPDQVVMVGDSLHDLHAGRAAGMSCVGVLTGMAGTDELAPLADIVLPDIGGLPAWLGL